MTPLEYQARRIVRRALEIAEQFVPGEVHITPPNLWPDLDLDFAAVDNLAYGYNLLMGSEFPKVYAIRSTQYVGETMIQKWLARTDLGKHFLWVDTPAGSMYSTHEEASYRAHRCEPTGEVVTFVELPT